MTFLLHFTHSLCSGGARVSPSTWAENSGGGLWSQTGLWVQTGTSFTGMISFLMLPCLWLLQPSIFTGTVVSLKNKCYHTNNKGIFSISQFLVLFFACGTKRKPVLCFSDSFCKYPYTWAGCHQQLTLISFGSSNSTDPECHTVKARICWGHYEFTLLFLDKSCVGNTNSSFLFFFLNCAHMHRSMLVGSDCKMLHNFTLRARTC